MARLQRMDGIRWKADDAKDREAFLEYRHAADMAFLSERLSDEMLDALPLIVMKQHEYL